MSKLFRHWTRDLGVWFHQVPGGTTIGTVRMASAAENVLHSLEGDVALPGDNRYKVR